MKGTRRRAGGLPNQNGESVPPLESVAPPELSGLALSLTTEVSAEEEEAESRDMAEAESELDNSPLEVPSEASVGVLGAAVLSSAATFCCGGQEAASKLLHSDDAEKSSVRSQTTGANLNNTLTERFDGLFILFLCLFTKALPLFALSASEVLGWRSRESDVCAAAGSAVCREEKRRRRPSAELGQSFTQKRCLVCPFTRQVE